MSTIASQITSLTIVYSTVYSRADQRKHQSSASLAFVWGIQRWPVNSPHKGPVTRKMLPFDDVIMNNNHSENQFNYPLMSNMSASSFSDGVKSLCGMGQQLTNKVKSGPSYQYGDWCPVLCQEPRYWISLRTYGGLYPDTYMVWISHCCWTSRSSAQRMADITRRAYDSYWSAFYADFVTSLKTQGGQIIINKQLNGFL